VVTLSSQLRAANRRRKSAIKRRWAAETVIDLENFRIRLLTAHLDAGDGHVFTPDPVIDLSRWSTLAHPSPPSCRLCGVGLGALASEKPCPGDIHACQADVTEGETPTAFRQYKYESWLCGQRGVFADDFSVWTCARGHRTSTRHQRGCLRNAATSCPCRFLIIDRAGSNGRALTR
jgi:hypothetical protein